MVFGLSKRETRVPDLSRYDYYYANKKPDYNKSPQLSTDAAWAAQNRTSSLSRVNAPQAAATQPKPQQHRRRRASQISYSSSPAQRRVSAPVAKQRAPVKRQSQQQQQQQYRSYSLASHDGVHRTKTTHTKQATTGAVAAKRKANSITIASHKPPASNSRTNSITVQTKKIKDPQGRTASFTRQTRRIVDGYEVIETSTITRTKLPASAQDNADLVALPPHQNHFDQFSDNFMTLESEGDEEPIIDTVSGDEEVVDRNNVPITADDLDEFPLEDEIIDEEDEEEEEEGNDEPISAKAEEFISKNFVYDTRNPYLDDMGTNDTVNEPSTPELHHPYSTFKSHTQKSPTSTSLVPLEQESSLSKFSDALDHIPVTGSLPEEEEQEEEYVAPPVIRVKKPRGSSIGSNSVPSSPRKVPKKVSTRTLQKKASSPQPSARSNLSKNTTMTKQRQSHSQQPKPAKKKPMTEEEMYAKALEIATINVFGKNTPVPLSTRTSERKSNMGQRMSLRDQPSTTIGSEPMNNTSHGTSDTSVPSPPTKSHKTFGGSFFHREKIQPIVEKEAAVTEPVQAPEENNSLAMTKVVPPVVVPSSIPSDTPITVPQSPSPTTSGISEEVVDKQISSPDKTKSHKNKGFRNSFFHKEKVFTPIIEDPPVAKPFEIDDDSMPVLPVTPVEEPQSTLVVANSSNNIKPKKKKMTDEEMYASALKISEERSKNAKGIMGTASSTSHEDENHSSMQTTPLTITPPTSQETVDHQLHQPSKPVQKKKLKSFMDKVVQFSTENTGYQPSPKEKERLKMEEANQLKQQVSHEPVQQDASVMMRRPSINSHRGASTTLPIEYPLYHPSENKSVSSFERGQNHHPTASTTLATQTTLSHTKDIESATSFGRRKSTTATTTSSSHKGLGAFGIHKNKSPSAGHHQEHHTPVVTKLA